MKKTQEIVGLPIITICDGMEIGKVKGLIINSDNGSIDYFVVDNGVQALSSGVIPTTELLGVGENAVTVMNSDVVRNIDEIPQAVEYVQKDVKVRDTAILTKKGRLKGKTGDFLVDEDNACRIVGLEYIPGNGTGTVKLIPRSSVVTFGKKLIILEEGFERSLMDNVYSLGTAEVAAGREAAAAQEMRFENASDDTDIPPAEPAFEPRPFAEPDPEPAARPAAPITQPAVQPESDNSPASLFEQRQKQYLNGRRATKTITDNNGSVIISEGMTITDEIIDEAKSKGKLIELVMNNKA